MNKYIEQLLQGREVEWKPLGEVADFVRGLTYNKSNESETGYQVLRANNITISTNSINFDDIKTVSFETKVKDSQKLYKGDILISIASGSREHVGKVAFIDNNLDYYFGGFMGVVRCDDLVVPRFLFHILNSNLFSDYLDKALETSTINNISSKIINGFSIPIPPMDVQREIVRILDNFTELEKELEKELKKELELRKKQYEYYREKLLEFGNLIGGGYHE